MPSHFHSLSTPREHPVMSPLRLYFIRHFPTCYPAYQNAPPLIGITDAPARLPSQERQNILAKWHEVQKISPESVTWHSSPKSRCCQTAAYFQKSVSINTPPHLLSEWIEQDFGIWEQKSWHDINLSAPEAYHKFWQDPYHTAPPEGESMHQMRQRVTNALNHFLQQYACTIQNPEKSKTHFIFTHAGVIRCLLAHALDLSPEACMRLDISPAHYTLIQYHTHQDVFIPHVTTVNSVFSSEPL